MVSFKEKFPVIASILDAFSGNKEVNASENFNTVEMAGEALAFTESNFAAVKTKLTETETALTAANNELAEVKAANAALTTEKETLTAQVAALTADVAAKETKLAEYATIAAGGGHTKPAADVSAEVVDVADKKLNYSAESVELG